MSDQNDFREDDERELATPVEWMAVVIAWAASTAFLVSVGYVAWQAIKRQDVGDLLILSLILVALPAWVVVYRASNRQRDRELYAQRVSEAWLREQKRSTWN